MKLYADHPPRRARQIAADVFFVVWIFFWIWQGWSTYQSTMELTRPTERTEAAATKLGDNMRDASEALVGLPLVGEAASAPFTRAADSAEELATAATAGKDSVKTLALKFGISLAVVPTAVLGGFYVPIRRRFIREATAGQRYLESTRDIDLFALRGLANQPMDVLVRISDDPAGSWRRGDPAFMQALAGLEMHRCGLTPPFPNPMNAPHRQA